MSVLAWAAPDEALIPAGLVAAGAAIPAVLALLGQREPAELARLKVVATRALLVILGSAELLPWVDGVRYCAPATDAPQLWLPTNRALQLPSDLVQQQLAARTGRLPVLLWHAPEMLLPLDQATELTPALLDWLSGECG